MIIQLVWYQSRVCTYKLNHLAELDQSFWANLALKIQIFRCFGGTGVFHGRSGYLPAVVLTGVSPLQTISPAEFLCTALISGFVGFFEPPYLSIWLMILASLSSNKELFCHCQHQYLLFTLCTIIRVNGCVCFSPFTKDLLQLKLSEAAFTRPVEHLQITPFDFSLLD